MFRFLTTLFTRITSLVLSFIIVLLNSRYLGAGGMGVISLITLTISIFIIINELVGGGALVYLAPRYKKWQLLKPAYGWACISSFLFFFIIKILGLVPQHLVLYTSLSGLIFAINTANFNYLIGMKKVIWYNLLYFMQLFILFILLVILYRFAGMQNEISYVFSLMAAYLIIGIISFILVLFVQSPSEINTSRTLPIILKFGALTQLANLIQLFNYRFGFYIIQHNCGKEELGRFSIATQISETSWIIGRSSAIVNYSDVSNSGVKNMIGRVLLITKFIGLTTFLSIVILNLIPAEFYKFMFGKEFTGLNMIIHCLSPGIILLAVSMVICSYFSGTGKVYINTTSSLIGLLFTIPLALWIIPKYGISGAAVVCSISYGASAIWTIYQFKKRAKLKLNDFFLTSGDVKKMVKITYNLLHGTN